MSRDILDLIDNAIAGATSDDAMRWTPDAEKVTEPSRVLADLRRRYEAALDALVLGPQVGPALTGLAPISVGSIQGFHPTPPGFAPLTIRSPIRTQVWREPGAQRVWIAPLGTPQPVGPIEDSPAWVKVNFAQGGDIPAMTAVTSLAESLSSFLRHAGAAIGPAVETMREAGMIPEQPPADPMARALWLRQHRNTGPAIRSRAPRRIDARRAR